VCTKKNPSNPNGPRLDEYCTTEDYLYGEFKKWVNNYGVCSDEARTGVGTTLKERR